MNLVYYKLGITLSYMLFLNNIATTSGVEPGFCNLSITSWVLYWATLLPTPWLSLSEFIEHKSLINKLQQYVKRFRRRDGNNRSTVIIFLNRIPIFSILSKFWNIGIGDQSNISSWL